MNKAELKIKICEAIDQHREEIISIGEDIYSHPELGYKEFYATNVVCDKFKELGLSVKSNIAVTGCRGSINEEKCGPRIAILGEIDAIMCSEHKDADKETGAVHACGHHIQTAAMIGVAIGLIRSKAFEQLNGKIDFMAVPAEEFVELEYRSKLKEAGKIKFFGGKQELIANGEFDDVNMSMMIHSLDLSREGKQALIGPVGNGFIGKKVQFIGKESHAGGAPEKGINALNAAMLAINNIHAQRETFAEADKVRVHPIITKGGDIVNVVPADVRMESYVRARTIDGMIDANKKVNRSLLAGAMAIGASVKIDEIPGYLPLLKNTDLDYLFKNNLQSIIPEETISEGGDFTGSFDFGDVSHIMPTLHPMIGGISGDLHTRDFKVSDKELAYIVPAKAMATTVVDLLFDNAKKAKDILATHLPTLTKEEYLDVLESISSTIEA
ncbi:amidohydrolase [Clostridium sediminicola]|uniref:amidohydrolase n=1 Tax=Clostridium sediminicola TaxID=3114879 RepID=UPI0031F254B4